MKRKFTSTSLNWIIGAIMLLLGVIVLFFLPASTSAINSTRSVSKADAEGITSLKPGQTEINTGIKRKSTISFLSISTQEYTLCDNCQYDSSHEWTGSDQEGIFNDYLIRLSGWKLKPGISPDNLGYILPVDNEPSYRDGQRLSSLELEQVFMKKLYKKVDVPIPFRIDLDSKDIMIPVSKRTMDITHYTVTILMVLFILYFFMFVVGDFIKFLIAVAEGDTFTHQNVNRLKFIALNLFIIPYGFFLINLSLPLIFSEYFTDEIVLDTKQWIDLVLPTILSLIFAALYSAFKQGKQLNDEAELTI